MKNIKVSEVKYSNLAQTCNEANNSDDLQFAIRSTGLALYLDEKAFFHIILDDVNQSVY